MKRFFCLLLAAVLLLTPAQPPVNAAPAPNPTVRIGLNVGANAMIAANLQNDTGAGYEFGFLNADNHFIPLGATVETKITMVKNRNVYLAGGAYTETAGDYIVGAFHDNYGSFSTREEAEAAVLAYRAQSIPAFVSYASGAWAVRSGSYPDSAGGVRVSGSQYCISVVRTGTTDIIFQFDYRENFHLCVRPLAPEGVAPITWHRGLRYYGMFEFRRFEGNNIYVYNAVGMQDYVKGVIPYEMSPAWPVEALKAQAVCARTFAVANLRRHRAAGYDLCTTEHCQVYRGTVHASDLTNQAVDETVGQYLTYDGEPCNTVYHSSSGGATENSENVWTQALPYLRGVVDPYEDASVIPQYNWSYTCTNAQLSALLTQRGVPHDGVSNFYVEKYTGMNNVLSVAFTDRNGKLITTFTKESARTLLNSAANGIATRSQRYTVYSGNAYLAATAPGGGVVSHTDIGALYAIDGDGNVLPLAGEGGAVYILSGDGLHGLPTQPAANNDTYTVIGRGRGHNVGMSQWGARGMAEQGLNYQDILHHYFTGVEISSAG